MMENSITWDITPCNLIKVNQHFGELATSIFMVEEQSMQETSMEQAAGMACWLTPWTYTALYPRT
jgi:hypothetical protein